MLLPLSVLEDHVAHFIRDTVAAIEPNAGHVPGEPSADVSYCSEAGNGSGLG